MRFLVVAVVVVLVGGARLLRRRRPRSARSPRSREWPATSGDVALVMARELRERVRSRFYVVGTVIILLVLGAAIVIPVVHHSKQHPVHVGVVGAASTQWRDTIAAAARSAGATATIVTEANAAAAASDLSAGRIDLIVGSSRVEVAHPIPSGVPTTATMVARAVASSFGEQRALHAAHLTEAQIRTLTSMTALPVVALHPGPVKGLNATSLIGVILIFMMLSQYNTWIMIGVMEEKSSRVIEVLLSAVRPMRLLTGKVVGIGLAALLQASVAIAFAMVLATSVGSHLLQGTTFSVIAATLVWLLLGYGFYCWVYAAAGSLAERQDQVQSLALPLSLPMVVGYVVALTAVTSSSPSLLVQIFSYIPLTAPFTMPVLVGLGDVSLWQVILSAAISIGSTVVVARVATGVYQRAILRTGARVRLRDVRSSS